MEHESERTPRILLVKTHGRPQTPRIEPKATNAAIDKPRSTLLETSLGCTIMDESSLAGVGGVRGAVYARIPAFVAQALEAKRLSERYDVVVSWSEKHTVAIAAVFALTRVRTPHIAMMFWMSKPIVKIPLTIFRSGVDRVITWSSVQQRVAVEKIGFRASAVTLLKHPVDVDFYMPQNREHEIIFSAGSTQRDFDTLAQAVQGLAVPVQIAASIVVSLNGLRAKETDIRSSREWPKNVRVEALNTNELRDAYARASVVVVPLLPSDIDAGVNVILEAMSMGRPVIVSRTEGQVDVVVDRLNAVFVPPGDADALKSAIQKILDAPKEAEAMGTRARSYVEANHRLVDFIELVRGEIIEVWRCGTRRRSLRNAGAQMRRMLTN